MTEVKTNSTLWLLPNDIHTVLNNLAEAENIDENYREGLLAAMEFIHDMPGFTRDEVAGSTQFFFSKDGTVKCLVCRKEISSRQYQYCPHCGRVFVGSTNDEWEATKLRFMSANANNVGSESETPNIPIWEKENLTITEAASYFGIGQNKIRALTEVRNCNFVLFIGSKRLIKRKAFAKFLEAQHSL